MYLQNIKLKYAFFFCFSFILPKFLLLTRAFPELSFGTVV